MKEKQIADFLIKELEEIHLRELQRENPRIMQIEDWKRFNEFANEVLFHIEEELL